MRKPVKPTYDSGGGFATETAVAESPLYYENDTPIYRSQTEGATIEDDNGNVLCCFIWRNRSVVFWRTGPKADGYLPVTVYTQEAMSLAQQKAKHINMVFYGVYAAESRRRGGVLISASARKSVAQRESAAGGCAFLCCFQM